MKRGTDFTHVVTGADGPTRVQVFSSQGPGEARFVFSSPADEAVHATELEKLREAVAAGTVREIEIVATVCRTGSCANHFLFDPVDFDRFAWSFKGKPFLRDHLWQDDARGGTIRDSWTEQDDAHGKVMKQRIALVKRWAMDNLLDGTLDRFSIGALAPQEITCSICSGDPREAGSLFGPCHWPGTFYDTKGKATTRKTAGAKMAEFILRGQEGVETSTVVVPAFSGTGLSAMKLTAGAAGATVVPYEEIFGKVEAGKEREDAMQIERFAKLFGLADDATEDEVYEVAQAARNNAETNGQLVGRIVAAARLKPGYDESDLLALVMERAVGGASAVAKLQDELASVRAEHAVDKAIAAGKFTVADREDCLADAKLNLGAFEKVVARRSPIAPALGEVPPGSETTEPRTSADHEKDEREFKIKLTAADAPLTRREREVLRQMAPHINPEAWLEVRRESTAGERSHLR